MSRPVLLSVSLLFALTTACGRPGATDGSDELRRKGDREQISYRDDPRHLIPNASWRLIDNITEEDVGQTFGVPDEWVPYPDTYWPFTEGGIDKDWTYHGSPLEKYMAMADPYRMDEARSWEHWNHGPGVPGVQDWFGHCPGWAASAITLSPVVRPVAARLDPWGRVQPCNEGEEGCVRFEVGDINALQAEVFVDAESALIGSRCDTAPNRVRRDQYGRIIRTGAGCQGLNPGSLMIVLGNWMKARQAALVMDVQDERTTNQIWNQPAYRYTVHHYVPLTEAQAANLVAYNSAYGDLDTYLWNGNARGFVYVELGIHWVTEHGPNYWPVSGLDSTREMRVTAVLELDASPSDPDAYIIGGEYLDDPSVGANRLRVPPFVWLPYGPGPEDLPSWVDGSSHNPYVKPSVVMQLVALGQQ